MAEGKLALEIVTPEKRLVSEQVDEVTAPGHLGEFGALPRHTPYLCGLDVGVLTYRIGSGRYFVCIGSGYAEVGPDKVTVLAEVAEIAEEIDTARAKASLQRAESRMGRKADEEEVDFARAESSLRRAITRISVAHQSGMDRE